MSDEAKLISVLISLLSRNQRDQFRSRKCEHISRETVWEIEIRSISVRIYKTDLARTEVLESTSASVSSFAGGLP